MKALAAVLMLIACMQANAIDWKEHPYDKASHIVIGGALSCGVAKATGNKWYGLLAAIAVGTAKEIRDDRFDRADLASWGVGGAVGMMCWDWN